MFYTSLTFSAVLFAITAATVTWAGNLRRRYMICIGGLFFGAIPGFCVMPAYLLHAVILLAFAFICMIGNFRARVFVSGSLLIFAGVYLSIGLPRWLSIQKAIELYPQESVATKLNYEAERYRATGQPLPKPIDSNAAQFRNMDYWSRAYSRMLALKDLHDHTSRLFVEASGFGVSRMVTGHVDAIMDAEPIRLAPPVPLPQPTPDGYSPPITTEETLLQENQSPPADKLESLLEMSRDDFLNPLGFGYVRDRQHVTGYLAHRFTKYPTYSDAPPRGVWRLETLDLISLLKHAEPVAYVSKHLPRMDELRDAPTRPLDEFEKERLSKLRAGENVSAGQGPRRIRMLGALRAREVCLNCHTANENDLLGAFSYDLRLDVPADRKR